MIAPEPLCDLEMIKADYRLVSHKDRKPDHFFRISVIPDKQEIQFDVPERRGEQFAAELEALAAIIRSRVIRAKLIGEECELTSHPPLAPRGRSTATGMGLSSFRSCSWRSFVSYGFTQSSTTHEKTGYLDQATWLWTWRSI